jgi:hypothetical protein
LKNWAPSEADNLREGFYVSICPHCHQTIGAERLGVRLTPLKAEIVDKIKTADDIGVSSTEIVHDLYRDRHLVNPTTIKAHVCQINDLLAATVGESAATGGVGSCVGADHENVQ